MINALLIRYAGGWAETVDAASVATYGRHEGLLGLGSVPAKAEAIRVANQQLAIFAQRREEISADLQPIDSTDTPYAAFGVGDRITVPGLDGTPSVERVRALTVTVDNDTGRLSYAPELKDVLLESAERFEQTLKKMADGTLSGESRVATPITAAAVPAVAAASMSGAARHWSVSMTTGLWVSSFTVDPDSARELPMRYWHNATNGAADFALAYENIGGEEVLTEARIVVPWDGVYGLSLMPYDLSGAGTLNITLRMVSEDPYGSTRSLAAIGPNADATFPTTARVDVPLLAGEKVYLIVENADMTDTSPWVQVEAMGLTYFGPLGTANDPVIPT